MHLHFDPIGGIAGDMFIAALLHAFPELHADTLAAIRATGIPESYPCRLIEHRDQVFYGMRFQVEEDVGGAFDHAAAPGASRYRPHQGAAHTHEHTSYADIRARLKQAQLHPQAREHALGIFALLAQAEAKIHGVPEDHVSFHEVGAWDSIADIVGAGALIHGVGASSTSCAPLPLGSGRVRTAHGMLPVPAPATALLIEGLPAFDDGRKGERITPTGAAIVRYLHPAPSPGATVRRLTRSGFGFGTKTFSGISNVLRVLAFEAAKPGTISAQVALIQFEVDDQSAEDLALGLERLRALETVLDVLQMPAFGKKGRMLTHVQVLARADAVDAVAAACFQETSTIGLRVQHVQRSVLARKDVSIATDSGTVAVKVVQRPDGSWSAKAQSDDVVQAGGRAQRERRRRAAEQRALDAALGHDAEVKKK